MKVLQYGSYPPRSDLVPAPRATCATKHLAHTDQSHTQAQTQPEPMEGPDEFKKLQILKPETESLKLELWV